MDSENKTDALFNEEYWYRFNILFVIQCILVGVGYLSSALAVFILIKDTNVIFPAILGDIFGTLIAISDYGFPIFVTLVSFYRYALICNETIYKYVFKAMKTYRCLLLFCWLFILFGVCLSYIAFSFEYQDSSFGIELHMRPDCGPFISSLNVYIFVYFIQIFPFFVPVFCCLIWRKLEILRKNHSIDQTYVNKGETSLLLQITVIWLVWFLFALNSLTDLLISDAPFLRTYSFKLYFSTIYILMNTVHPYIYFACDSRFREELHKTFIALKKKTSGVSVTI